MFPGLIGQGDKAMCKHKGMVTPSSDQTDPTLMGPDAHWVRLNPEFTHDDQDVDDRIFNERVGFYDYFLDCFDDRYDDRYDDLFGRYDDYHDDDRECGIFSDYGGPDNPHSYRDDMDEWMSSAYDLYDEWCEESLSEEADIPEDPYAHLPRIASMRRGVKNRRSRRHTVLFREKRKFSPWKAYFKSA